MNNRALRKYYPQYYLIPGLLVYTLFHVYPNLSSFAYSLTNWNSYNSAIKYIGLKNYNYILVEKSYTYLPILGNTLLYAVGTSLISAIVGLLFALAMNREFKSRNVLRSVYFIPYCIAPIIVSYIFKSLLHPTGFVNQTLSSIGLSGLTRHWLVDRQTAMGAVIGVTVWMKFGINMVIFLAGLQTIDRDYYEAARIDGASQFMTFWYITFPLLSPAVTINILLNFIDGFKAFDLIYALTNGGPGDLTEVLNLTIYNTYTAGMLGRSTAMTAILFFLTLLFSLIIYAVLNRRGKIYET